MSNTLAIGAVTATLRHLLEKGVAGEATGINVTTLPPDKAKTFGQDDGDGRVNLFLYQTQTNAAWRNLNLPRQVKPGESGQPPLGLDLFYLVTAYEKNDGDSSVLAHRLLGRAMHTLYDHPLLGADEIEAALAGSELPRQIERVRITPHPMSLEELSKLWVIFQTEYRISAAYQVSVVLIESTRPTSAPLPVLQRGKEDLGSTAGAGVSLPILEEVCLPNRQSSALLGDELLITGQNLDGLSAVRFTLANPRLPGFPPISIPAPSVKTTDRGIQVTLPNDAAARTTWVAGFYTVAVVVNRLVNGDPQTWSSNELPLSLAPRIEKIDPGNVVARDANGHVTLTLTCNPEVRLAWVDPQHMRFEQQVVLLLGTARQVAPQAPPPPPAAPAPPPAGAGQLTFLFSISATEVGAYWIRLRVDGADLLLVDRTVTPPRFDPTQQVTIT